MESTQHSIDNYRQIDRVNTLSEKWNKLDYPLSPSQEGFVMTFADMEFPLSPDIRAALLRELSEPDVSIGYSTADQTWRDVVYERVLEETGEKIDKSLIVDCIGVFQFISVCVDMLVG
jgi:bifunctional pyridoxal-dependent enzyme with beta-cystathionase and maltose regulon repressor activities